jgi:hypothetical protein
MAVNDAQSSPGDFQREEARLNMSMTTIGGILNILVALSERF